MYDWRRMTPEQRSEALARRQASHRSWHGPPHGLSDRPKSDANLFHVWAACYEHRPVIGHAPERMTAFEADLLEVLAAQSAIAHAWCLLPNHYHLLAEVLPGPTSLRALAWGLGRLHGRTSHAWNAEESNQGRTVWYKCGDRTIRSERHFWATMNYVHHNPVKHGYASKWTDWPWSSATSYLDNIGRSRAADIWRDYPVLDFGKGWDD